MCLCGSGRFLTSRKQFCRIYSLCCWKSSTTTFRTKGFQSKANIWRIRSLSTALSLSTISRNCKPKRVRPTRHPWKSGKLILPKNGYAVDSATKVTPESMINSSRKSNNYVCLGHKINLVSGADLECSRRQKAAWRRFNRGSAVLPDDHTMKLKRNLSHSTALPKRNWLWPNWVAGDYYMNREADLVVK